MNETNWWQYLSELMGSDTPTAAARKAGISASNFTQLIMSRGFGDLRRRCDLRVCLSALSGLNG